MADSSSSNRWTWHWAKATQHCRYQVYPVFIAGLSPLLLVALFLTKNLSAIINNISPFQPVTLAASSSSFCPSRLPTSFLYPDVHTCSLLWYPSSCPFYSPSSTSHVRTFSIRSWCVEMFSQTNTTSASLRRYSKPFHTRQISYVQSSTLGRF